MNKKLILISIILCFCLSGCMNPKTDVVNNPNSDVGQVKTQFIKSQVKKSITQEEALRSVDKLVGPLPKGYFLNFDHVGTVSNKEYYVFHLYESVIDNKQTGEGHSVTYGWYYVDKSNGEISKMDMSNGDLTKVTENKSSLQKKDEVSYKQYINGKFGFSIDYPSTFRTKMTPDNNDGIILTSSDGNTELTISGINNILYKTALSYYNDLLKEHGNASYKKQENNWLIVSWIEGDKISYQKTVVGSGSINTFLIKYPLSQKDDFDSIVSQLNTSFKTPDINDSH